MTKQIFNIGNINTNLLYQAETINISDKQYGLKSSELLNIYHLVGDNNFGNLDERMFKQINISTTRINDKETFLFLLNQKPFNNYLHFSGHSTTNELIINLEKISCFDLPELIIFDTILLASCKNFYVAECFAKIAKNVVCFLEEIENLETSQLSKEFWQNIQQHKTIEESIASLKQKYDIAKYIYYI